MIFFDRILGFPSRWRFQSVIKLFNCALLLLLIPSIMAQQISSDYGQVVLDLVPGLDNPRNGEGDMITLRDGSLLFIYTKFSGDAASDHAPAQLVSRSSKDQGSTWTVIDQLEVEREGDMNVMSVSLLRLKSGSIGLFYLRKNSLSDCIPYLRISDDEGAIWSEAVACIQDRKGYFVLNNDRVVQLENGRLLMPVSRHKTEKTTWSHKGELWCYYSDDQGASWSSGPAVPTPDSIITQEPGVVALRDGRLMMFIRASGGKQLCSFSNDHGENWSMSQPMAVNSPISPASIERISSTGDLIMVWNNNGASGPGYYKAKRTPLTIAISSDEGKTWNKIRNLEYDPDGFYCYSSIHQVDDYVLLSYLKKTPHQPSLGACIRRLRLDQIYGPSCKKP